MTDDDKTLAELATTSNDLQRTFKDLTNLSSRFASALTNGLKDAVVEGKKLDQVLREVALSISGQLLNNALAPVQKLLSAGVSTGLSSLFAPTAGNGLGQIVQGATPGYYAEGGVFSTPTYFPTIGGGVGLAGEAGAAATDRRRRGQCHVSDSDTGCRGVPPVARADDGDVSPRRRTGTARALTPGPARRGSGPGVSGAVTPPKGVGTERQLR